MYPEVFWRASNCVCCVLTLTFGEKPPLARNPGTPTRLANWGSVISAVTLNWGGNERLAILSNRTSYDNPKPARIDVLPLVPGEYATPIRGAHAVFCAWGALNSSTPGALAMAFRVWVWALRGGVVYSYRTPRLSVRFGRTRHVSW